MASKTVRRQAGICAIAAMLADTVQDHELMAACRAAAGVIGRLDSKDLPRVGKALDRFRRLVWADGLNIGVAASMLVCLVSDQVVYTSGGKRAVFEAMLAELERLLVQDADADHEAAFRAAELFTELNSKSPQWIDPEPPASVRVYVSGNKKALG